jgi:hypothetical protein
MLPRKKPAKNRLSSHRPDSELDRFCRPDRLAPDRVATVVSVAAGLSTGTGLGFAAAFFFCAAGSGNLPTSISAAITASHAFLTTHRRAGPGHRFCDQAASSGL